MKWYSSSNSFRSQKGHFLSFLSICLCLPISILRLCDDSLILDIAFLYFMFVNLSRQLQISIVNFISLYSCKDEDMDTFWFHSVTTDLSL